jgi:hypothetical protein
VAFVQRRIEIAIRLATNSQTNQPNKFVGSGADTISFTGFRTSVRVQNSGAPTKQEAQVSIFGLQQSTMNELATLGMLVDLVPRNTITIMAGNAGSPLVKVFTGTIFNAYGNYSAAPDVPFHLECQYGMSESTAPAVATSYTGMTDVVVIMEDFAKRLKLGFENNGVTAQLSRPYFSGSLITQMQDCAVHANITAEVINGDTLAICPKFSPRKIGAVPLISADTEMIGYPSFTQQGIIVKTMFNPQIQFMAEVRVDSSVLKPSNYIVQKLDHALDSQVPRGQWMSTIYGYGPNAPRPILPPT